MLAEDLIQKIAHARSLSQDGPHAELGFKNLGEVLMAQGKHYDTKPFLIFYDIAGNRIEYGYKDFYMLAQQCANLMRARGVRKGDRILTISHNHADTVIQYFAAWLMGACVVPVSLGEDDGRIAYILENSKAKLAFLRMEYAKRIMPIIESIPQKIEVIGCCEGTVDEEYSTVSHFDLALEAADPIFVSDVAITHEEEALIVYTSGTTGNPKGVVLTQANLLFDAKGILDWHQLTNHQRIMCVLPIHHVNGTIVTLVTPMLFGGTVVLNQKFQSEHFFERIAREGVHVVSVVPTLLAFLIEYYNAKGLDALPQVHTLRHLICGAGPLTVELAERFEDMFGITVVHGYGLSETTCYSCFLPTDLTMEEHASWMRDFGFPSIGCAIPQNEMMIADENGREVEPSERGEIAIRGVNVMKYYYENDEANEQTFKYGWFRSGDEGFYELDRTGRKYFFITGRLKELIIRGGINIAPLEIDEVIARCPGVKAGIAVGFENDFYGEEVGAYVQLQEGAAVSESDVLAFCQQHLPFSKSPKKVVIGNDIPVTTTGKYQRNKLKPLFKEWRAEQFRKS